MGARVADQKWQRLPFELKPAAVRPPVKGTPLAAWHKGIKVIVRNMRRAGVDPAWCDLLERGTDLMLDALPDLLAAAKQNYSSIGTGPDAVCTPEQAEALLLQHIERGFAEWCEMGYVPLLVNPLGAVPKAPGGSFA